MAIHLPQGVQSRADTRREDWLANGVLSGFIATFAMTVVLALAYAFASAVGSRDGSTVERWFWALANNTVTDEMGVAGSSVILAITLNLAMGLALALVYARLVEPAVGGRGWRKGMLFSLIPWIFSIVAFLPIMGGGWFGMDIEAGPLPILGNLVLHLVYGAILGSVYGVALDSGLEGQTGEHDAAVRAQRGGAIGLVAGSVVGAIIGLLVGPSFNVISSDIGALLAGGLVGAGCGLLVGSLIGIGDNAPIPE
ncbi:MAG: DUF6789 family protein [Thermomicrobiales bacterium]